MMLTLFENSSRYPENFPIPETVWVIFWAVALLVVTSWIYLRD